MGTILDKAYELEEEMLKQKKAIITIQGIESYYGGKAGSGVYQTIINNIPPHQIYIEPFLGSGAIMRTKLPAPQYNIGCELDKIVHQMWQLAKIYKKHNVIVHNKCGIAFLEEICSNTLYTDIGRDVFIYADPPYLMESRKNTRKRYKHEMSVEDHIRLLTILVKLPFNVAISCYENMLYPQYLGDWRKITYQAATRRGTATEVLYLNYPAPDKLHDYQFTGSNFRERERIKQKIKRHVNGLLRLPVHERNAIIEAITNKF